jgi:RNA polymerase sigma factor (sigma-70 family)
MHSVLLASSQRGCGESTSATRRSAMAIRSMPAASRPQLRLCSDTLIGRKLALDGTLRLESTAALLHRVRDGDLSARERLCAMYLPILRRWAAGQMPHNHRDLVDTADLTQITLIRVLNQIDTFQPRHEGAFLGYLRDALLSSIRDEIRRSTRRGGGKSIEIDDADWRPLVAQTVGMETLAEYEQALGKLLPEERELVLLRFEFGLSFQEIAEATERASADAARMAVKRALISLSELLT